MSISMLSRRVPVLCMLPFICCLTFPGGGLISAQQTDAPVKAEKPVAAQQKEDESGRPFGIAAPENRADLQVMERRIQSLITEVTAATVAIRVGAAQGSGVIVSADGYVLTAAHVAGFPGRRANVMLADGRRVSAITLGMNRLGDAALLKISNQGEWSFAKLGDAKEVAIGDWCLATGHPGGYDEERPPVVRLGRIVFRREKMMQTDCTLVGGDSGGPLFDMRGRVIGIHSRIGLSNVWNFHASINTYLADWDRMVAGEAWGGRAPAGKALLGVGGEDHPLGCRVSSLVPDLPAITAGMQVGDIITKLADKPVQGFSGLAALVKKHASGEKVTIDILRNEDRLKLTVILTSR